MTRKIIVGAAIAAVAVTILLTFSNTAYSSPIGDEVFIRVQNENIDVDTTVIVDSDSPEFTVAIPAFFTTGPTELTIDIGVDTNGDGTIWLTYTSDNENLVPFHVITIQDINWIDTNTGPIPGIIVDLQCDSDFEIVTSFSDDEIQLALLVPFELTDIHCTFFAEHEIVPIERVRDNVDIENIKLKNGQFRVIVDNAGIAGTSNVEITWVFDPEKCVVIAAGDVGGFTTVGLVDDGAFSVGAGVPVGHNDVKFAEAILLGVNGDAKDCKIDSKKGEYVSVSTVGMGGPGPLDTSNPTGP